MTATRTAAMRAGRPPGPGAAADGIDEAIHLLPGTPCAKIGACEARRMEEVERLEDGREGAPRPLVQARSTTALNASNTVDDGQASIP